MILQIKKKQANCQEKRRREGQKGTEKSAERGRERTEAELDLGEIR